MVRGVEEKLILKAVLPQLTKLARDSEMYVHIVCIITYKLFSASATSFTDVLFLLYSSVRVDTIASFGTIMETVTSKDVRHDWYDQLHGICGGNKIDSWFAAGHKLFIAMVGIQIIIVL